jgi:peptidoglycan/xylan/chitin deacetylase (PgdA/CDA1 family)
LVLIGALAWPTSVSATPDAKLTDRGLLVTVDDLPIAGHHPERDARTSITEGLLAALRQRGVHAVGFVIWGHVRDDADRALLRRWLAEGHELGNHSEQHPNLSATTAEAWIADVERGRAGLQAFLDEAAPGQRVRFLRFPYLREGDTPEKVAAVRRYLESSGQRNLPVTIDNQDWSFDEPWSAATRAGDKAAQVRVASDYHAALRFERRHHIARSDELWARPVPQVLLLHANAVGAAQWPVLFDELVREGLRFARADEVLADAAFADLPAVTATHGFGLWERIGQARGEQSAVAEVKALLERQAQAWSRGDIVDFCSVYADDVTFISPSGLTQGRQAVLERYQKRYPGKSAMGRLTLDVLEARTQSSVAFTPLGGAVPSAVASVSVVARWTLAYEDKPSSSGLTLLVLRRTRAGFQIVQDASM